MSGLNKHLLIFSAMLFILMLVPTAFAINIDDESVVDFNNQLAVDDVSQPTDDVVVESLEQSVADEKESTSVESDVLEANDVIYVDGFDGSGGSGTSGNPYHSLKNVLNSSDLGNQIYLLPGTYDFGGTTVALYEKDFTLNAVGDVIFTSSGTLFNKYGTDALTLNGIQFRDITSSSSAILYTGSSVEGTLILNNCSFINNKGANLFCTSYNIYAKGCTFINNEATGTNNMEGGLIENAFGSTVINITHSIFIGNKIHYSNNGVNPIIVNGIANLDSSVYFDYNFVNDNDPLTQDEIIANGGALNSYYGVNLVAAAPSDVFAGSTVDLAVNFTKTDGSALSGYMPNLNVALVPAVNVGSIPVTITNNGGKGQYTAENRGYTESVDVKYGDYVLTTFEFYVSDGGLLNPELNVPESLIVDIGGAVDIGPTHAGNGAISYASADESVVTVDANGVVTGVGEGITTITVNIAATDAYGEDTKQVTVMVKDPADANVIYVDGFDESDGGSGIKVDPYHSLKNVLVSANSGKEIRLLPGTYDFASTIDLGTNTFVLTAIGDVIFTTSKDYMFKVNGVCTVTFNGIKFKDSTVDGSVITRTFSSNIGTLNFHYCDFINNTGDCLIKSSSNVNIKGCAFIDNKATGTGLSNAGLIHNYYASTNTINISYSVFINNEISYSNNPIVVDWNNGNGPAVIFNYNFVNDNNQVNDNAIAYHARITKGDYAIITATAPNDVFTGHAADLVVNFTKSQGGALDDYMPNLTVSLLPTVKFGSIPVTITNNGGKGQYIANKGNPYYETVVVKVNDNDIISFGFYVKEFIYTDTSIAANDLVMDYKDGSAWEVTLNDVNGNAIFNATVEMGININGVNKIYSIFTDENGVARLPINLAPGSYAVNATFDGDDTYEGSFADATVTVNPATPVLSGDDLVMRYRDGSAWEVTLTDANGNAVSNVYVKIGIKINGVDKVYSRKTDANGVARLPINLAPGSYAVNATFDGNSKYVAAFTNATVTVKKALLTVSAEDLTMDYKDGSSYKVNVVGADGNAVTNIKVKFTVKGKDYNIKTDSNGVAELPINLKVGNYTITATVNDANYESNNINNSIVVTASNLAIVANDVNMTYKDGTAYEVQLVDSQGNPVALAGQIIKVTVNGISYDRKTDANGIARLQINLAAGSYSIKAEYNGIEITNNVTVIKP